jgi:SagB-type dehydrogenase family enzyme
MKENVLTLEALSFSWRVCMKARSYDELIRERRGWLKAAEAEIEEYTSHQRRGVPAPPLEKPFFKDDVLINLPRPDRTNLGNMPLAKAIGQRESRRRYTSEALRIDELSFLLWATQGVKSVDKNKVWNIRTVPSGGARHPFETYLIVNRVEELEPGVYRYLPLEHKLLLANRKKPTANQVSKACCDQDFAGKSAVVFVWTALPYRTEWRYSVGSYKSIAVEAGHVCQNLYLACEAIGAGACAILAYEQNLMDTLIGVDGEDEFTIYVAPVGKV